MLSDERQIDGGSVFKLTIRERPGAKPCCSVSGWIEWLCARGELDLGWGRRFGRHHVRRRGRDWVRQQRVRCCVWPSRRVGAVRSQLEDRTLISAAIRNAGRGSIKISEPIHYHSGKRKFRRVPGECVENGEDAAGIYLVYGPAARPAAPVGIAA